MEFRSELDKMKTKDKQITFQVQKEEISRNSYTNMMPQQMQQEMKLEKQKTELGKIRNSVSANMPQELSEKETVRVSETEVLQEKKLVFERPEDVFRDEKFAEFKLGRRSFRLVQNNNRMELVNQEGEKVDTTSLKEEKISFYNKSRWFNWIPGVRTAKEIKRSNADKQLIKDLIEKQDWADLGNKIQLSEEIRNQKFLDTALYERVKEGKHRSALELLRERSEQLSEYKHELTKAFLAKFRNEEAKRRKQVVEDKQADCETLFSLLTKEQQESKEVKEAMRSLNGTAILKVLNQDTGDVTKELSQVHQEFKNDKGYMKIIEQRLNQSNPLSRFLLQKTQHNIKGFDTIWNPGASCYSPETNKIELRAIYDEYAPSGAGTVIFHEMGHMTDQNITKNIVPSEREIQKAGQDAIDIIKWMKSLKNSSVYKECLEKYGNADTYLKDSRVSLKEKYFFLKALQSDVKKMGMTIEIIDKDASLTEKEGKEFHDALRKDYDNYKNKYVKPVYFSEGESEEEKRAVQGAIANRLYQDILLAARDTYDQGGDMSPYGGSVQAAAEMVAKKVEELVGKPIKEQRAWLKKNDPLTGSSIFYIWKRFWKAQAPSDMLTSFAYDEKDNVAQHIANNLPFGHKDADYFADKAKEGYSKNRVSEAWAEMTEAECGGQAEKLRLLKEYLPNAYESFKKLRRSIAGRVVT